MKILYPKLIIISILLLVIFVVILVILTTSPSKIIKTKIIKTNSCNSKTLNVKMTYPTNWQLKEQPTKGTTYKQAIEQGKAKLSFAPDSENKESKLDLAVLPTNQDLNSITKQYALYKEKEKFSANGFEWSVGEIPIGGDYTNLSCIGFGVKPNISEDFKEFKNKLVQVDCQHYNLEKNELADFVKDIRI